MLLSEWYPALVSFVSFAAGYMAAKCAAFRSDRDRPHVTYSYRAEHHYPSVPSSPRVSYREMSDEETDRLLRTIFGSGSSGGWGGDCGSGHRCSGHDFVNGVCVLCGEEEGGQR